MKHLLLGLLMLTPWANAYDMDVTAEQIKNT